MLCQGLLAISIVKAKDCGVGKDYLSLFEIFPNHIGIIGDVDNKLDCYTGDGR